jgi:hypothetical protein
MRGSPVLVILWERETVPPCGPPSRARSPHAASGAAPRTPRAPAGPGGVKHTDDIADDDKTWFIKNGPL